MKLVVDTNRVIASLIKNSLSRRIINHPFLEFITPDYTLQELSNRKKTQFFVIIENRSYMYIKSYIYYSILKYT